MNTFKKLVALLGIGVAVTTSTAQTTVTGLAKTYTQTADSLFTYLNKNKITTGILYDRIYPFADLITQKDSVISDYSHFMQSWHELHTASYNPDFTSAEELQAILTANSVSNNVPIGIINTRMNYIDYGTDILPTLTFSDGYLRNILGINPIREKLVTVIAPLKEWINKKI